MTIKQRLIGSWMSVYAAGKFIYTQANAHHTHFLIPDREFFLSMCINVRCCHYEVEIIVFLRASVFAILSNVLINPIKTRAHEISDNLVKDKLHRHYIKYTTNKQRN